MKLCEDIENYIKNEVIPKYRNFDKAHDVKHINYVIERSIDMADLYGQNINVCYVAAAFHDLGIQVDRKTHEIVGAQMVIRDSVLKKYFDAEEMQVISRAIEEHRASFSGQYSSIYSKILAQADRNFDINLMTERAILYGLEFYSEMNNEQQYYRVYSYLKEKYGKDGKVKLLLEYPSDEEEVKRVYQCLTSERRFRKYYTKCWHAVTRGDVMC